MITEVIKGRIIRIIDKRTVVINLGKEQGITGGSIFYILAEPEAIIDPATDETLGTVNVTKSRIKASQVFEKFTIATTSWTEYNRTNSYLGALGILSNSSAIDEGELKVDSDILQPWKARSATPVTIGDEVEVTISVEEESEESEKQEAEE